MKRCFFWYLLFTVVFYAQRYLFGWGAAGVTLTDDSSPTLVRLSKDAVWIFFLLYLLLTEKTGFRASLETYTRNRKFFRLLIFFCVWMCFAALLQLFHGAPVGDAILYCVRYPLEYIPIAFLVPTLLNVDQLKRWVLWAIALSFGFLILELAGYREALYFQRYGSIFGSPNDFGIFCAIALMCVLIWAQNKKQLLLAPLLLFGLYLSLSRSAIAGLLVAATLNLYLPRVRKLAYAGLTLAAVGIGVIAYSDVDLPNIDQVVYASEHFSSDESASMRLEEYQQFQGEFGQLEYPSVFLFGTRYFHIENFYAALLVRGGFVAFALYLSILWMTLKRGWQQRADKLKCCAFCAVVIIATASLFIPSPDVFPTNFYMWMAVGIIWA